MRSSWGVRSFDCSISTICPTRIGCVVVSEKFVDINRGQNLYERAKCSIEEVSEAELTARGAGAGLSGRLRYCAGVMFPEIRAFPWGILPYPRAV
jgi:hypothetical protein